MKRYLAVAAGVASIYLLRLDSAAGLIVDDAWYAVLAKALSQGDGFRLISSATVPIVPTVPPGYPLLLAPLYLISPQFPANIWLLKLASVAAMMGVGFVVYRYFIEARRVESALAALLACATVLTPAFVFLATSTLMAECVFTLGQVLTVVWVEKTLNASQSDQRRHAIVAGVLAGATMLVRTAGAATLLGAGLYLLYRRATRPLIAFSITAILCLTPWLAYSVKNAPTSAEIAAHGGTIAYPYSELLMLNRPGDPSVGRADAAGFVARVGRNAVNMFGRDLGGIVLPVAFRGSSESGEEVVSLGGNTGFMGSSMGSSPVTVGLTLVLSAVAAIGFLAVIVSGATAAEFATVVTLLVVLSVPTRTFRYLVPLTPFLLFYFSEGLTRLAKNARAATIALTIVLAFHLLDHAQYIRARAAGEPIDWLEDAKAATALTGWMNANLPPAAVASTNPGLVYLLTGRKTVATDDFTRGWPRWKAAGIRYMVALRPLGLPQKTLGYRVVYESKARHYWVVDIEGP